MESVGGNKKSISMILLQLFGQFLLISLLSFGGGQAVLPLVERVSVAQMGWISPTAFAAAVAFGYITPGPVLITATFVGYIAAGIWGAIAASLGVFIAPTLLAMATAAGVERFANNRWLKAFGRGAAPAVVGLLGATAWSLVQSSVNSWQLGLVVGMTITLATRTQIAPGWLLLGGAIAGWTIDSFR